MRGIYSDLFNLNNELIGEYAKRSNNHQALLAALKKVNATINRASNLRIGKAKAKVRVRREGNVTQAHHFRQF